MEAENGEISPIILKKSCPASSRPESADSSAVNVSVVVTPII